MPTKFIEQLTQQAGTSALGGIMGMALGAYNDNRQEIQQRRLQNLQLAGEKTMVDYNMMKQLQMWKDTNYSAQMEQLRKAGLNPGLLYGMGGGGGQSMGTPTGNVTGATAQQNPGDVQSMIGMGLQNGLLAEQRRLIQAQTENVQADTQKKTTADIPNVQMQTASLAQGIKNQQAVEKLTQAETELKNIDIKYAHETYEDRVDIIIRQVAIMSETVDQQYIQTNIDRATAQAKTDTIRTEAAAAIIRNALMSAQIGKTQSDIQVNQAQIKRMSAEINKMAADIAQNWDKIDIEQFNAEIKAMFPGVGAAVGNLINNGLERAKDILGDKTNYRPYKVKFQKH